MTDRTVGERTGLDGVGAVLSRDVSPNRSEFEVAMEALCRRARSARRLGVAVRRSQPRPRAATTESAVSAARFLEVESHFESARHELRTFPIRTFIEA